MTTSFYEIFGSIAFIVVMLLIPIIGYQFRHIYELEQRVETLEHDLDVTKIVVFDPNTHQLIESHIKRTYEP